MKSVSKIGISLLAVFLTIIIVGCGMQERDGGGLLINVGYDAAKQIVSGELGEGKLEIGEYLISGVHPASGASFDRTIVAPDTTCSVTGITPGTWNIDAVAMNISAVAIELGAGSGSGEASAEATTPVSITVVPYVTTAGVLELNVLYGAYVIEEWRGEVRKPGVVDPIHTFSNLDFTSVDQGDGTKIATATLSGLEEGWYFISIELWDEISQPTYPSVLDSGLLDCALITAYSDNTGMTTVCDWALPVSGGISIEIIPDLYNILEVVLTGIPEYYERFSQPQVTATVDVPGYSVGDVQVIFALDGDIKQEGIDWSYTLPDNIGKASIYGKNTFRVDALVYTLAGNAVSMGSSWDFVTVVE